MTTTEAKQQLEQLGHEVETMHVAVGNIYRCQALDGWGWMYEQPFLSKAAKFIGGQNDNK